MPLGVSQLRVPVSLRCLFPRASFVGCADIGVSEATENSDQCGPGVLFAAISGTRADGAAFVGKAIERGASALLVSRPLPGVQVPQCVVPNVRKAYGELCHTLAAYPSRRLGLVGVTGTNGKTTVTWLVRSILRAAGKRTGLLGTIEYSDGFKTTGSTLTTPDSKSLSRWLARMVERHTTHAAIELSSHALDQHRAAGTWLDAAIVTNVTQDHFDYHGSFEAYLASKERILDCLKRGGLAVFNADDPGSSSLRDSLGEGFSAITYGVDSPADVTGDVVHESLGGTRFVLHIGGERAEVCTRLIGRHNVSNCLAAAAAAAHFGIPVGEIVSGIESLGSVRGRLERVDCGQPWTAFVDYAHTDDALRRCVRFLKKLTPGRVICVFGAGGDRDRSKRPLLGRAAAEADLAVVTSDNPRSEDPERIIEEILSGFVPALRDPYVEPDRAEAIRWALEQAEPGDSVLVAGKGHETEQIIGAERLPFDDREVIRSVLSDLACRSELEPARLPA